ncbi:hypothetical protein ACSVDE_02565 [Pseudalkalibacillus sp. Hm43]|uniref:hypothetical protein n=1 Tax=Pseudalkalibacillus sp. Hm43 TaxID=3450742 RepID=UPI003F422093
MNARQNFWIEGQRASWTYRDQTLHVQLNDLKQGILDLRNNTVLLLTGPDAFPNKLIGFTLEGVRKFEVEPPSVYVYSYLTNHKVYGAAVVCLDTRTTKGWSDWYFSVNTINGELTREGKAY